MFVSFSRRVTVLLASCAVAFTAASLATTAQEDPADRLGSELTEPDPERVLGHVPPPEPTDSTPAPIPRPGHVAVCGEPGRDEIVVLPDPSAPGEERPLWIRRPPGPDSADLPVLYLLHGSSSTHDTLMEAGVGELLDRQMCRMGVEFVVAAPYGQVTDGSTTEWADAHDGRFALEEFVTDTAVTAVEGEHRRPRSLRAIGGFSMGGYGAAALALRSPDLYSQVVSWAGYFRVDDPDGVLGENGTAHSPDRLLGSEKARDLRFLLVEGREDHTPLQEGSIHGEAERFSSLLAERGMTVTTLRPPGGHDLTTWKSTFPDAVDFLVSGWAASP